MKYLEDESLSALTAALSDAVLGQQRQRVIHGRVEAFTMKRAGNDKKLAQTLGNRYVAELQLQEDEWASRVDFQKRKTTSNIPRNVQSHLRNKSGSLTSFDGKTETTPRKRSQSTGTISDEMVRPFKQPRRSRASSFDISTPSKRSNMPKQKIGLGDFTEQATRRLMTDLILTMNMTFPDYDFSTIKPTDFCKVQTNATMQQVNERLSEVADHQSSLLSTLWTAVDKVIDLKDADVYSYQPEESDVSFLRQSLVSPDSLSIEEHVDDDESSTLLWSFNFFFVNKALRRLVFFSCIETMRRPQKEREGDEQEDYVTFSTGENTDVDFDLDPSATAGGIPISTV
jgi:hypothetical protein